MLHGESFRVRGARRACGRGMRPQGVGRFEAVPSQPGVFLRRVFYSATLPTQNRLRRKRPVPWAKKAHQVVVGGYRCTSEIRRSLEASLRWGWRGLYLHLTMVVSAKGSKAGAGVSAGEREVLRELAFQATRRKQPSPPRILRTLVELIEAPSILNPVIRPLQRSREQSSCLS